METHTETQTYIETHGQAVSILYASGRGRTRRRWPITAYAYCRESAKGRVVELDLEDRPSVHARAGKTAWLGDGGWDSGRTRNCLTHALPRYLPTPNSMEAWRRIRRRGRSAVAGRRGPLGRRLERVTALDPSYHSAVLTGPFRGTHQPSARADRQEPRRVSVPKPAGFSLIT